MLFELRALMWVAIGISVVLFLSLERSRTNTLVSAGMLTIGLAIGTIPPFWNRVDPVHPGLLARLQGVFEVGAIVVFAMFMLTILESSTLTEKRAAVVRVCGWSGIGLGCWHAIASFTWPAPRLNDYELALGEPGFLSRPGFWLFATFWLITVIPYAVGWALLSLGAELDPAEARRAQFSALASVFAVALTVMPPNFAGITVTLWICIGIYGQLQYTRARAERGVFLSRFLSPRVTELVATRGFAETMKPHHAEITVVSADLRGFTSYSEGVPSQAVVDLLVDYYDAIGVVAARHGATITNYAGDGILILVGAPVPDPEHAVTGITLASELLVAVAPVLSRWQTRLHSLGLGIGVASGKVTVGAIASESRMEYTAVGMPVNLAARLCAAARPNEILIDAEAARLSKAENVHSKGEMKIKGFSDLQRVYAFEHMPH
jgi:class 3 adenylate cyclase